jgi:hypothetical protein
MHPKGKKGVTRWIFLSALVLSALIYVTREKLPPTALLTLPVQLGEPIQEPIDSKPTVERAGNYTYTLTPRYSYDITGVVVSRYDSGSLLDFTHKQDPWNVGDICVVWGKNALSGVYRSLDYRSGEFTCFVKGDRAWQKNGKNFDLTGLSNNHILPANAEVAKTIQAVKIGDQIRLVGNLVDYEIRDAQGILVGTRHTSTVRNDTGNGACEVVHVAEVHIIRPWRPWSFYAIPLLLIIALFAFITFVVTSFHRANEIVRSVASSEEELRKIGGERHRTQAVSMRPIQNAPEAHADLVARLSRLSRDATHESLGAVGDQLTQASTTPSVTDGVRNSVSMVSSTPIPPPPPLPPQLQHETTVQTNSDRDGAGEIYLMPPPPPPGKSKEIPS